MVIHKNEKEKTITKKNNEEVGQYWSNGQHKEDLAVLSECVSHVKVQDSYSYVWMPMPKKINTTTSHICFSNCLKTT